MKKILMLVALLIAVGCSDSSKGNTGANYSTKCGDGSGAADSPYVLCNASDLKKISDNLTANYILADNISLSGVWVPIGSKNNPFKGTFNARGYKISGLEIDSLDYLGLFGYIDRAAISNLVIELSPSGISGNNYIGIIAGWANASIITACSVEGSLRGKNNVGGIAGYASESHIEQVSSGGTITAAGTSGGIVGEAMKGSVIVDSYSSVNIASKNFSGGIAGSVRDASIVRCFASGSVENTDSASTKMGGIAGSAVNSIINGNMALNIVISGQRDIGRIAGVTSGTTVSANYGIDMPIWGVQDGGERGVTVTSAEASSQAQYESMGWQFGSDISSPWRSSSMYPIIDYWKILP